MQIIKTPDPYASAFQNAIFKLSAMDSEVIEIDILDHTGNHIIGRKKLYGNSEYDVNVANYVQGQFEIMPLDAPLCTFAVPQKRIINVSVAANGSKAHAMLNAGLRRIFPCEKLSSSPDVIPIDRNGTDEIAFITENTPLRAIATLSGKPDQPIVLAQANQADGLTVFCLVMKDLQAKALNEGLGNIENHNHIAIQILDDKFNEITSQNYHPIPASVNRIKICWWNSCGQIDSFPMRQTIEDSFLVFKEKILTPDGYKVTSSARENHMTLVSDFLPAQTMKWISEITVAPRVWIEQNAQFIPVDVLNKSIVTKQIKLSQIILQIRETNRKTFQHL